MVGSRIHLNSQQKVLRFPSKHLSFCLLLTSYILDECEIELFAVCRVIPCDIDNPQVVLDMVKDFTLFRLKRLRDTRVNAKCRVPYIRQILREPSRFFENFVTNSLRTLQPAGAVTILTRSTKRPFE